MYVSTTRVVPHVSVIVGLYRFNPRTAAPKILTRTAMGGVILPPPRISAPEAGQPNVFYAMYTYCYMRKNYQVSIEYLENFSRSAILNFESCRESGAVRIFGKN